MFGGIRFRTACTELIFDTVQSHSIPRQECVEYVEDHKAIFNHCRKRSLEPPEAVYTASKAILFSLRDGNHESVRSYHHCKLTVPLTIILANTFAMMLGDEFKEEQQEIKEASKLLEDLQVELWDALKDAHPDLMKDL